MDTVAICNLALGSIGGRTSISSLDEQSVPARQCSLQYAPSLEAVLQAAHWNFARAQVVLTLLGDATKSPPDPVPSPWLYEYAYPSDCVQVRYIMPTFSNLPASVPGAASVPFFTGPPVRFVVSTDLDSQGNRIKVILTNQPMAQLVYTARVTDPSLFDGQFVIALVGYLATRLCVPLSGDKTMAKMAFDVADVATKEARASNGNEGITVIDSIPDWMRARGYAADWAYPPGSMFFTSPQNLSFVS